jgi:hypothetical protein
MGILKDAAGRFGRLGALPGLIPASAIKSAIEAEQQELAVRPVEQPDLLPPAPSRWSLVMLRALQDKQVYQGTVPAHVKERRRAKNKMARKTRRVSRQRAQ